MDKLDQIILFVDFIKNAIDINSPIELNRALNEVVDNEQAINLRSLAKNILSEELKTKPVADVETSYDALQAIAHLRQDHFYLRVVAKIYSACLI